MWIVNLKARKEIFKKKIPWKEIALGDFIHALKLLKSFN